MENKYTNLIGYSENTVKDLHGVEEVAEFICEEGLSGDVEIITPDGELFITTFGMYLDKVKDIDYRNELVKVLVPMQKKLDLRSSKTLFLKYCPSCCRCYLRQKVYQRASLQPRAYICAKIRKKISSGFRCGFPFYLFC